MSSGIEEMEAELNAGGCKGVQDFSLCIEKILQGLRKFRNHSENFATIAKISQSCEISLCKVFHYDSENSLS